MMTLADEVRATRALPAPQVARAIRRSAGVSQARLATELGVTRATIARWESAARSPRGDLRVRYATALSDLQEAMR